MRSLFASYFLAVVSSATLTKTDFLYMQHLAKQNKSIESVDEFTMRSTLFAKIDKYITEHNGSGKHSYTLGHNFFSDLTPEERQKYTSKMLINQANDHQNSVNISENKIDTESSETVTTNSIDWVSSNCMAPIQDQGQCGACWAFSAVGSLESAYCIATEG